MGYDIRLSFNLPTAHIQKGSTFADLPRGGQYAVSDPTAPITESDLYLYITFNYSWYFSKALENDDGIKRLIGKTTTEAIPLLKSAYEKIMPMIEEERGTGKVLSQTWGKGSDYDESNTSYWCVSAKNAAKAINDLITLCELAPDATINIDY